MLRASREFARADAAWQALGEGGDGVLAMGRDQFAQCRNERGMGETVALNAREDRLGEGFRYINQRGAMLFRASVINGSGIELRHEDYFRQAGALARHASFQTVNARS